MDTSYNGAYAGPQELTQEAQSTQAANAAPVSPAETPQLPLQNADQNLEDLKTQQLQQDSWGNKVYHGVLSALGGKYDTQFIPTPQGVVQTQVAQTPGQQWKRIISGAITGLGGAAAAGTQGPGGTMRGLGGGIQAGYGQRVAEEGQKEKTANTQFEQDQKAAMTNAQTSMLAQQKLNLQWEQTKQKMQASRDEIQAANEFEKVIGSGGSGTRFVAHAPDLQAAIKIAKADPSVHADHAGGYIQYNDHIDPETGKHEGVDAYYVAPTLLDSKVPFATTISVPVTKDGKATTEDKTIDGNTLTYRDWFNVQNTLLSQKKDQALIAHTEEETKEMPEKTQAEIRRDAASAAESNARADSYQGKTIPFGTPLPEGMFDPDYPPPQNFPAGTQGIDQKQIGKVPAKLATDRVLAQTILENTAAVVKIINHRPDLFGKIAGREASAQEWLGTNDGDLAEIYQRLENIARPSVGIHGTRAQGAVFESRQSLMNGLKNSPKATLQSLLANADSSRNFIRAAKNYETYGTAEGPNRGFALHAPGAPVTGAGAGGNAPPAPLPARETAPPDATGVRWDGKQSKYIWTDKNGKDILQ